jgi:glycerophosphoryl diester phosphodiesterase
MRNHFVLLWAASFLIVSPTFAQQTSSGDQYIRLMTLAQDHARSHHAENTPVLSPVDASVLGDSAPVNVASLHKAGFKVVPWTTNDPDKMRQLLNLRVDGIISDRPDLLRKVLEEEKAAAKDPETLQYLASVDVAGHRGGRGLRPENTLPAFEGGLDNLINTIETDTGVTTDRVSLIWHDQFLNPQSCRKADGSAYTMENRTYIRDISMPEAQRTFICDKLHFGSDQKNDLSLSPVAVAFAAKEKLISPYVPTYVDQLYRFVAFYADYYEHGAGKNHPQAAARAENAKKVRFNLETKIMPDKITPPPGQNIPAELLQNHTVGPDVFVATLCGTIARNHMESRSEVQSFDFRTLILVEEKYPAIPTYYLTGDPHTLNTEFVPASLRVSSGE